MPLLSKTLAIQGDPQTPFVTAVTRIPFELHNSVKLRALCAILSSSISNRGADILVLWRQTESFNSRANDFIQQVLAILSFCTSHKADIAVRFFLGGAHQSRKGVPL